MFKYFINRKKRIYMNENKEYKRFSIGDFTYGKPNIIKYDNTTQLTIGKYTSIADNVTILLGGEHRMDWVTTYPFNIFDREAMHIEGHPSSKGNIIIGNDVWIGYNCTILSGVTIGDGAVIAANTLVHKDIQPYEVVGGNPMKHIKYRFDINTIEELMILKWWNCEHSLILNNIDLFLTQSIDLKSIKKVLNKKGK